MFKDRSVLAIVPARGGSKGVHLKNIHPLGGKPLVAWTGEVIQQVSEIDRAIVSSDHPDIIECAKTVGLECIRPRPEELSGDQIADLPVLCHELEQAETYFGKKFEIVLMLQPTAPLRRAEHIRDALALLIDEDFDSVWSVSPSDPKHHPLKQFRLEGHLLTYYDEAGEKIVARQQLEPLYHRNGAVYAIQRECLLSGDGSIKGERCGAYLIEEPMVSIDTLFDFEFTEFILRKEGR